MEFEEYATALRKVMDDHTLIYASLVKDLYSQGIVLGRKYRLLRMAYGIFSVGLICSVAGYILAISIY